MSTPAPEPEVVAEYSRAALQNARDLIGDAESLLGLQHWPRACSLAVLAMEEASKAVTCTIMPMLPPDHAREYFAWPFAEINRAHGLKLGTASMVSHVVAFFTGGPGAPARYSPALQATEDRASADNDLKQRGFYVTYRDERIMRPADVCEQEAVAAIERATMLTNVGEEIVSWSENLSSELLEARGALWNAMIGAYQQGGYDAMGELSQSMFGELPDEAMAEIREGLLPLMPPASSARPGHERD